MRVWATQLYLSFFIQSADLSVDQRNETLISLAPSFSLFEILKLEMIFRMKNCETNPLRMLSNNLRRFG